MADPPPELASPRLSVRLCENGASPHRGDRGTAGWAVRDLLLAVVDDSGGGQQFAGIRRSSPNRPATDCSGRAGPTSIPQSRSCSGSSATCRFGAASSICRARRLPESASASRRMDRTPNGNLDSALASMRSDPSGFSRKRSHLRSVGTTSAASSFRRPRPMRTDDSRWQDWAENGSSSSSFSAPTSPIQRRKSRRGRRCRQCRRWATSACRSSPRISR